MMAFRKLKEIMELSDVQEKHRQWLFHYEGQDYSKAVDGRHLMKWQTEPQKYRDNKWSPDINLIKELPTRTRIEFDGDPSEAKKHLDETEKLLKEKSWGYIRSSHNGKSDYLWVQFNRPLLDSEKKAFLMWIAPKGSEIDLNFASSKKVFPVLFAVHWKHSFQRELPVAYNIGHAIDYDSLGISEDKLVASPIKRSIQGFEYETAIKEQELKPFELHDYSYFKKLKPERDFLVKGLIGSQRLLMLYSPPKNLKSIFALALGLSVANGKNFLGMKTKKNNVLIIDQENNESDKKDRLEALRKGMRVRNNKGLYYLSSESFVNILSPLFIQKCRLTIKKYNIKLVILDTFRRMSSEIKENDSDSVSRFFSDFYSPLRNECKISCLFLHHSTKTSKKDNSNFRGSGDFEGMVDSSFNIGKTTKGSPNRQKFKVICDVSRSKVVEELFGFVDFQENSKDILKSISFSQREEDVEDRVRANTFKKIYGQIMSYFESQEGTEVKRSDINSHLKSKDWVVGNEKGSQRGTISNVLKYLIDQKVVDTDGNGRYWKT